MRSSDPTGVTALGEDDGYLGPVIELEIRWPSIEYADAPIGTSIDLEQATGLSESDLKPLLASLPEPAVVSARSSSQGKGASGPAFAVIVEIERIATDGATLIVLGTALRSLIGMVARKVHDHAVIEDPNTLGAIALAASQDQEPFDDDDLGELKYMSTVPVTAFPGVGTNASDIWAACFKERSGDAVVVFISPDGTWLGRVRVPAKYYFDSNHQARQRTAEGIRQWWL